MSEYLLIMTTVPDEETAERISRTLVEDRLAACVSHSSSCRSSYWWTGKIVTEKEHILFIKTSRARYPELEKKLVAIHPYEVPEVLAIPVAAGYGKYLDWIRKETDPGKEEVSK